MKVGFDHSSGFSARSRASETRADRKAHLGVEAVEPRQLLAVFLVTSASDSGPNSLRQAILDANVSAGADTIQFSIPGTGPHLIQPSTPLPPILDDDTFIDGYSQPGSSPNTLEVGDNASLQIQIDGKQLPIQGSMAGLLLNSSNNVVRGLSVTGFGGDVANRFGIVAAANGKTISGNHIYGNFIGLNADGSTSAPVLDANGNFVLTGSGNTNGVGIRDLFPNQNYPQIAALAGQASANVIGRDVNHTPDSGYNAFSERNLIAGSNDRPGISAGAQISGAGAFQNTIAGNYIGTDPSGNASGLLLLNTYGIRIQLGAHDNIVGYASGGLASAETRNVIGGTSDSLPDGADTGILLYDNNTSRNRIAGNYIGIQANDDVGNLSFVNTAIAVNARLQNVGSGGDPDPGTAIEDTVIVDNDITNSTGIGILILGRNTQRTLVDNNGVIGNAEGVVLTLGTHDNIISRNLIANNEFNGVSIGEISLTPGLAGGNNRITENSIFNNGRLGIDLIAAGETGGIVTPNDDRDVDQSGSEIANYLTNYPSLTTAINNGANVRINGSLNALPNTTYRIEFFASSIADPSGFGEGDLFLGFVNVTTNASGNAAIPIQTFAPGSAPIGSFITTTATNETQGLEFGSTSEFSPAIPVTGEAVLPSVVVNDVVVFESDGVAIFTVTLSEVSSSDIFINISTANNTALAGPDYLTTIGSIGGAILIPSGSLTATFQVPIVDDLIAEPTESFFVNISSRDGDVLIADPQGIGMILDDDPDVCILIEPIASRVQEPAPGESAFAVFRVRLMDGNGNPMISGKVVQVDFRAGVVFDAAQSGSDYNPFAGTLVFQPGETEKTLSIPILQDFTAEDAEAFTIQLSNPVNAELCPSTDGNPTGSSSGMITDNPNVINNPTSPPPPPPANPIPTQVLDVQRLGFHWNPTSVVIRFSAAVNPLSAQNINNYSFAQAGRDGRVGTADDIPAAIRSATPSNDGQTVTLRFVRLQPLRKDYLLRINGSSSGVLDVNGNPIDGDGDGLFGGVHFTTIGQGNGLRDLYRGYYLSKAPLITQSVASATETPWARTLKRLIELNNKRTNFTPRQIRKFLRNYASGH